MKRYIVLAFFSLMAVSAPLVALAARSLLTLPAVIPHSGLTNVTSLYGLFQNVVGWVFVVAVVLAVLMLIIAGIMYMTAGGDQAKASKAMKLVMYALIGVAIAALAWALVNVVGNYFVGSKLVQ